MPAAWRRGHDDTKVSFKVSSRPADIIDSINAPLVAVAPPIPGIHQAWGPVSGNPFRRDISMHSVSFHTLRFGTTRLLLPSARSDAVDKCRGSRALIRPEHREASSLSAEICYSQATADGPVEITTRSKSKSFEELMRLADARMAAALSTAACVPTADQKTVQAAGERPDDSVPGLFLGDLFVNDHRGAAISQLEHLASSRGGRAPPAPGQVIQAYTNELDSGIALALRVMNGTSLQKTADLLSDPGGAAVSALLSTAWQFARCGFNPMKMDVDWTAVMSENNTSSVPMSVCAAALDQRPGCLCIVADGSQMNYAIRARMEDSARFNRLSGRMTMAYLKTARRIFAQAQPVPDDKLMASDGTSLSRETRNLIRKVMGANVFYLKAEDLLYRRAVRAGIKPLRGLPVWRVPGLTLRVSSSRGTVIFTPLYMNKDVVKRSAHVARQLASAAAVTHRQQQRVRDRTTLEDSAARIMGASHQGKNSPAIPQAENSEDIVPEEEDLLQEIGLSNRSRKPLDGSPVDAFEATKRAATELALGCLSIGLRMRQQVHNLADGMACRLGLGTRLAGLSSAIRLRPHCLSDIVSDMGRHNASILRRHRASSDISAHAGTTTRPWLPLQRTELQQQLHSSFGEAAARAAASMWLQEDPSRWCSGLGVAPATSSCQHIDCKGGETGGSAIAAAASLPRGTLSAVQLHFRPLYDHEDDLDLGPAQQADAHGNQLDPHLRDSIKRSMRDLAERHAGHVGCTSVLLATLCDEAEFSDLWSNVQHQIPEDKDLPDGMPPVTHGILLVGNTDADRSSRQLMYGREVAFPSMGYGDAQHWAAACHITASLHATDAASGSPSIT